MRIERVYVAGFRGDIRYTRCCVASIRRWYPDIPISLLKNESSGAYDTTEIERYWDVDCVQSERRRFDGGMAKLEPLFRPERKRYFIMDSDTVMLGRVLEAIDLFDADFVVNISPVPEQVERHMFDLGRLHELAPEFDYRDQAFNSGQYIGTSGLIARSDFAPLLTDGEPQRLRHPGIFHCSDQGVLNYVVLKKVQEGQITLASWNMMWWAGEPTLQIDPSRLDDGDAYPYVLHWAGRKQPWFRHMAHQAVLDHYERFYYARIPNGRWRRRRALLGDYLQGRVSDLLQQGRTHLGAVGPARSQAKRSIRARLRRLLR